MTDNEDMKIGERIKQVRKERRLTQVALAKIAKVQQSTIADLERGRTEKTTSLVEIAYALGVNPAWLSSGKGRKEAVIPTYSTANGSLEQSNISPTKIAIGGRVPLISLVAAGNWEDVVDNYAPGQADEWIATTVAIKQHTYALRVQGDSMEPKFPDGAIIIVEPEDEARHGSYVIVRQNGTEATFKQLVVDGGRKYLKPLNERYPIMQMNQDAVICGVVKQMVMDI